MSVFILSKDQIKAGKEPKLQVSKWLEVPVLLDLEEMRTFLETISPIQIIKTGKVGGFDELFLSSESFLTLYNNYLEPLKKGVLPESSYYRSQFALAFSSTSNALYGLECDDNRVIVRPSLPVLQMQLHAFHYSVFDQKFRSGVMGPESITWGVLFSYPQIFQDPFSHEIRKVDDSDAFPNTVLFKTLQKFIRSHTIPTPFMVDDKLTNTPIRLGKDCLQWINLHPQLLQKGLRVNV